MEQSGEGSMFAPSHTTYASKCIR